MVTSIRRAGYTRPTFARELLEGRARTDLAGLVGMAMRTHRRELGLPQRTYATIRGWPKSHQARLETTAEELKIGTVRTALEGTGFRLALVHDGPGIPVSSSLPVELATGDTDDELVEVVRVEQFIDSEIVAKDAAGRRFPVTRPVRRTEHPPKWWMDRYSTWGGNGPEWTCTGTFVHGW